MASQNFDSLWESVDVDGMEGRVQPASFVKMGSEFVGSRP
jgi:hypothetical protein